jgi:Ser/Thr protein kinase RdoA (MazF antagonist)
MDTVNTHAESMAQQALEAWGLQSLKRELISVSENIVFRVNTSDGKRLRLCLHRSWYHNLQELVSERMWTRALRHYGISTPVPVPALNGHDYVLVDGKNGETRYASMDQWVDGETMHHIIARSHNFAVYLRLLGRMAAQIHNQASRWEPPEGFRRHSLDADGLMGLSPWWGPFWDAPFLKANERVKFEHLRETLHDRLLQLDKGPDTYSMIHADLAPGNLIINGEHLHIIDFDDAGFGWHIYELATGLYPYQDHPRFSEMVSAVFEGYREVRQLDAESAMLLNLFFLVRALALVGWRAARPDLSKAPKGIHGKKWTVNKVLSISAELGL